MKLLNKIKKLNSLELIGWGFLYASFAIVIVGACIRHDEYLGVAVLGMLIGIVSLGFGKAVSL